MANNIIQNFSSTYSDLLSKHDYRGLVNLLSSSTYKNDETRQIANNLIADFTEQADIEDKLLEGADDNTRRAYNFMTSGPSKNDIKDKNSPSFKFMEAWNAMANDEGVIKFNFNTETEYNKFISELGGNEKKIKDMGISFSSNYGVSFNTDVKNKIEIFNAIDKTNYIKNLDYLYNKARRENSYAAYDVGSDKYAYEEKEREARNKAYSNVPTQLRKMMAVVHEANASYSKLLENTKPYISETIATGYMGEDDKKLQQAFSAGLVDLSTFKEARELLKEKYNTVLQAMDLSQYDVWSMNEDNNGSHVLQTLNDNIEKTRLNDKINAAIADGRLEFSHATNGLDIGTMIIINPKRDKDGNIIDSDDNKTRRLFVKDLFKSQAENSLRNNTEIVAQRQYAKHQTYKHIYRGSDFTITDWDPNSDTAVYTDSNGTKELLAKPDILNILDDDAICKRMIEYYNLANKKDKNGNGYTQEYYKVYSGNGFDIKNLRDNIYAKCLAAMTQKYNNQSESYIEYRAQKMVSTILKKLNIDFNNELK